MSARTILLAAMLMSTTLLAIVPLASASPASCAGAVVVNCTWYGRQCSPNEDGSGNETCYRVRHFCDVVVFGECVTGGW